MPIPQFSGVENVDHYIFKAKAYVKQFKQMSENERVTLLRTGIKDEAFDFSLGYSKKQVRTVKKFFQILKKTFSPATKLHELKQDNKEPIRVFAVSIRRYVCQMGLRGRQKIDRNCLQFFQAGVRSEFTERFNSSDTRSFDKAVRIVTIMEDKQTRPSKKTNDSIINTILEPKFTETTIKRLVEEQVTAIFTKFPNDQIVNPPTSTLYKPQPYQSHTQPNTTNHRQP
jgi:hypothetical protein